MKFLVFIIGIIFAFYAGYQIADSPRAVREEVNRYLSAPLP
jgi:hypothetical protein